jgi:hypothetical protein
MQPSHKDILMRFTLLLLSGFCLLGTLPTLAAPAEKESTYEVEVVIFENRLPEFIGDELLAQIGEQKINKSDIAVTPEPAVSEPYLYPTISNLLTQDGRYRVLAHQHWQQTIDAKSIAKPVTVVASNPAELEGTIRFFMSRHLHLSVDLLYRDVTTEAGSVVYRLKEQRKLKAQETHYFDHPRLGMLVRIMPLELDKRKGKL